MTKTCLCVCPGLSSLSPVSPSFLHACRKDSHVKDMAEWVHVCFSLSLSASPSIADSLALSPMWAQRTLLRATKSSLFAIQAREPLAPSPSLERRPRDTNRTWHPERGLRWRRKNVLSPSLSSLPHCLVSLCRLPSEGLRLQSGGEETGTDIEFVTLSDSWWRHLKEGYDLNSVIYVIMP